MVLAVRRRLSAGRPPRSQPFRSIRSPPRPLRQNRTRAPAPAQEHIRRRRPRHARRRRSHGPPRARGVAATPDHSHTPAPRSPVPAVHPHPNRPGSSAGGGRGLRWVQCRASAAGALIDLTLTKTRGQALGLHSSGMPAMQGVGAVLAGAIAEYLQVGAAMSVMAPSPSWSRSRSRLHYDAAPPAPRAEQSRHDLMVLVAWSSGTLWHRRGRVGRDRAAEREGRATAMPVRRETATQRTGRRPRTRSGRSRRSAPTPP